MRRLTTVVLAAGLGIATHAAHADDVRGMTPFSSFDAFLSYQDQDLRLSDSEGGPVRVDDSDIGGGLRARVAFGDYFFLRGGFQSISINNPDARFEQIDADGQGGSVRFREQLYEAGLRYSMMDRVITPFVVVGNYRPVLRFDGFGDDPLRSVQLKDSGLIYGGGLKLRLMDRRLHVAGEYRRSSDLSNSDFDEITVRVTQRLSRSFGVFVEYRRADFDFVDDTGDFDINDYRLGLRFSFGVEADDDPFF